MRIYLVRHLHRLPLLVLLLTLPLVCPAIELGPETVTILSHAAGHVKLTGESRITQDDLDDLESGDLRSLRERYEKIGYPGLTADQHRLLCDVYTKYNDIDSALTCLDELETRLQGPGDDSRQGHRDADQIQGKRALIHLRSGEYEEAMDLAEELASPGGRYVYGLAAAKSGQHETAHSVATLLARHEAPETAFYAANIFTALGDHGRALGLAMDPAIRLERDFSLKTHKGVFGMDIPPDVFRADPFDEFNFGLFEFFSYAPSANVYVEFLVGHALLETGSMTEARERIERVLSFEHIFTYRDVHWMALYERGRIAEIEGDSITAMSLLKEAVDVIESIRSSIPSETGRIEYVVDKQQVYGHLIRLLFENERPEEAMHYVERARSRTLVDILSSKRRIPVAPGDPPEAQIFVDQLVDVEAELMNDALRLNPALFSERRGARQDIVKHINRIAPRTAIPATGRAMSDAELKRFVNEQMLDDTVIGYLPIDNTWYGYGWNAGSEPIFVPLPEIDLDSGIENFRKHITGADREDSGGYLPVARELYGSLVEPLERAGLRLQRRISFMPHGPLWLLPFAALHDDLHFLGDSHVVRTLPSLTVLESLRPLDGAPVEQKNLLALGNPATPVAGRLPFAEAEAQAVAGSFKQSTLLLGNEATASAFRNLAHQYTHLHVASHAQFSEMEPLASALLLAPAGQDRGILSAKEITELDLNAELVALSACETALSRYTPGNDILGLVYAFLYARASAVLGSLWEIEDASTAVFMRRYYEALRAGPADRALRSTHRSFIAHGRYRHPYYWAAFQLTGR